MVTKTFRTSLFENLSVLIVLAILAGAVGGLAVGLIQSKSSTPATAIR
jgi:hypothetical protein